MRRSRLAQLVGVTPAELEGVLDALDARLTGGLSLIRTETEAALVIAKEASDEVREAQKKELGEEIVNRFVLDIAEHGQAEKAPMLEGRVMSVVINPVANKTPKKEDS